MLFFAMVSSGLQSCASQAIWIILRRSCYFHTTIRIIHAGCAQQGDAGQCSLLMYVEEQHGRTMSFLQVQICSRRLHYIRFPSFGVLGDGYALAISCTLGHWESSAGSSGLSSGSSGLRVHGLVTTRRGCSNYGKRFCWSTLRRTLLTD